MGAIQFLYLTLCLRRRSIELFSLVLSRVRLADLDGEVGEGSYTGFSIGDANSYYKLKMRKFHGTMDPLRKSDPPTYLCT